MQNEVGLAPAEEVDALVADIERLLPRPWARWPGGWPGQIEAALIDAVLSIRATYGQDHNGVRAAIGKWREHRRVERLDDLEALSGCAPEELADLLGNHQCLSGGALKTAGIVRAAGRLGNLGVRHAADLGEEHRNAYVGVRGLGSVTWSYFRMLLGEHDVKADIWITRFVGRPPEESRALVTAAAERLGLTPLDLDHAIWTYMRSRGQLRPPRS